MNRVFFGLSLLLLLFLFPAFVFLQDRREAVDQAWAKRVQEIRTETRGLLEELPPKAATHDFLQDRLLEFLHAGQGAIASHSLGRLPGALQHLYEQRIQGSLPRHDLAFGLYDANRGRFLLSFYHSEGVGMTVRAAEDWMKIPLRRDYPPAAMGSVAATLAGPLQFPFNSGCLDENFEHSLHLFRAAEGSRGLYIGFFPNLGSWQETPGILVLLLDMEGIGAEFGPRELAREWDPGKGHLRFLPPDGGPAIASSWNPAEGSLPPEVEAHLQMQGDQEMAETVIGRHLVCSTPPSEGFPFRSVLVRALSPEDTRPQPLWSGPIMGGCVLMALVMVVLIRKVLFGRGPRIPIGWVLFLAFLGAGLLPAVKVTGVFRHALVQEERRLSEKQERLVHAGVVGLEGRVDLLKAAHFQALRQATGNPVFLQELQAAAAGGASQSKALTRLGTSVPPNLPPLKSLALTAIMAVGPEGFSEGWVEATLESGNRILPNLSRAMVPMIRLSLTRCYPLPAILGREAGPGGAFGRSGHGVRLGGGGSLPVDRDELTVEGVRDFFSQTTGMENLLAFLYFPGRIQDLRTTFGGLSLSSLPIPVDGTVRFLLGLFWEERRLPEAFLGHLVDFPDPGGNCSLFVVKNAEEPYPEIRPMEEGWRDLCDLAKRAHKAGGARQMWRGSASGACLIEAYPLRDNPRTVILGRRPTDELHRQLADDEALFLRRVLLGAVGVTAVAWLSAWFFIAPLRRLLDALREIGGGRYPESLVDQDRPDEFGTLARTCLGMARQLEEKDHLSRYVSQSVRRAIEDADFHAVAREGELREVTILFSGIAGFEEFQDRCAPEDVCRAAGEHLAAMDAAVAGSGGDINKVIGEKILVVFDHKTLGSAGKAAEMALRVAGLVRESLAGVGEILPVIGITSGPVIAGILGAENFRVDYTVIGDTVNLASRLCTLAQVTGGSGIVLAGETVQHLAGKGVFTPLPFKKVKGKTKEITAFLLEASV